MSQHPAIASRPRRVRLAGAALAAVAAVVALAGCSPIVNMQAAPEASDTACADVVVLLPDTVADQPPRETDAQGTGAWGEPASVLLRCGVPPLGPTTDRCVSVDGRVPAVGREEVRRGLGLVDDPVDAVDAHAPVGRRPERRHAAAQ